MPRSAQDILADLPAERLRIGAFVVDATTRELTNDDGNIQRIGLKPLDLLLTLARQPGKVISREQLLETIWPDTLPTDEVVTQAIAQLRRAFGDTRPAEYIETIAKHGYRLIPEVIWLENAPSDAASAHDDATPAPSRQRFRRAGIVLAALAVIALIAAGIASGRFTRSAPAPDVAASSTAPATPLNYERLTSRPGSELWPNLSPDGAMVVYSQYSDDERTAALMVQTTAPVPPRALTRPMDGERHTFPAWSPDGRQIAFVRMLHNQACRLMRIPVSGGDAIEIAPCPGGKAQRFGWNPAGDRLILSNDGPLAEMDIASGTVHPLAYARGERERDSKPAYSPDGRWIAFQRGMSRADLWRIPAQGGTPQRLTTLETNLYGFTWTPDSQSLVLSRFFNHQTRLSWLSLASGELTDLLADASSPHVAPRSSALVFITRATAPGRLYRADVAQTPEAGDSHPALLFPSTGDDLIPALSPDGRRIAFLSDRSGNMRLWWAELDRPESLRPIEGIEPLLRQAPVWSEDSTRLLVVGTTVQGERLHEIEFPSMRVSPLPSPAEGTPIHAAWLPTPGELLVGIDEGDTTRALVRYDTRVTPWRELARIDDVGFFFVDAQRRQLTFTRRNSYGVWHADLDLGNAERVDDLSAHGKPGSHIVPASGPYNQGRRIVVWPGGNAVLASDAECGLRWTPLPRSEHPGPCIEPRHGNVSTAGFDPVHGRLYYTYSYLSDYHEDIGWARLP